MNFGYIFGFPLQKYIMYFSNTQSLYIIYIHDKDISIHTFVWYITYIIIFYYGHLKTNVLSFLSYLLEVLLWRRQNFLFILFSRLSWYNFDRLLYF